MKRFGFALYDFSCFGHGSMYNIGIIHVGALCPYPLAFSAVNGCYCDFICSATLPFIGQKQGDIQ